MGVKTGPVTENDNTQAAFFIENEHLLQFEPRGLEAYKATVYKYGLDLFHEARATSQQRDGRQSTILVASQDINRAAVALDLRRAQRRVTGSWPLKVLTTVSGVAFGACARQAVVQPEPRTVVASLVTVFLLAGALVYQHYKELSV